MKDAKLVAGAKGLSNIVNEVSILESPDSTMWLQEGDFILTNGRLLNSLMAQSEGLVEVFVRKKVAGIGVKLGRYLEKIPESMIDRANQRNFPIMVFPKELASGNMINAISYEIFKSEAHDTTSKYEDDVLRDLMIGDVDWRTQRSRLAMIGWKEHKTIGIAMVSNLKQSYDEESLRAHSQKSGFQYGFAINNGYVALADMDNVRALEKHLVKIATDLQQSILKDPNLDSDCQIGIGRCYRSLLLLPRSYDEACIALCMGICRKEPPAITCFSQLGTMGIMLSSENRTITSNYLRRVLTCLEQNERETKSDYIATLECYARNNMSLEKTAQELFLHYNTIRYRLKAIKNILSESVFDRNLGIDAEMTMLCRLLHWNEVCIKYGPSHLPLINR